MNRYLLFLCGFIVSCSSAESNKHNDSLNFQQKQDILNDSKAQLLESFIDSLKIGRKGLNKISVAKYAVADSNYVVIKISSKKGEKWMLKNEFRFAMYGSIGCDPQISDFNNDGLNDITYISGVAARGSNEVRTLFIYDKTRDGLMLIKNSAQYPNMLYNKELNCIDALLFTGCTTTAFLTIEADSLREFATVDQCDSITVSTYDKNSTKKTVSVRGNYSDFARFKSYDPLKEY